MRERDLDGWNSIGAFRGEQGKKRNLDDLTTVTACLDKTAVSVERFVNDPDPAHRAWTHRGNPPPDPDAALDGARAHAMKAAPANIQSSGQ